MPAAALFPEIERGPSPVLCPFTVVIDSNEQQPFTFTGLHTSAKARQDGTLSPSAAAAGLTLTRGDGRSLLVETVTKPLWAWGRAIHGAGLGDYSIDGHEEQIQVETKHSINDLFASIGQRRDNFEAEIASLNKRCQFAAVVVCGTWGQIRNYSPPGFEGDRRMSPASVCGTILAWQQRYPLVHWWCLPTRSECERVTFQILERYWRDRMSA